MTRICRRIALYIYNNNNNLRCASSQTLILQRVKQRANVIDLVDKDK